MKKKEVADMIRRAKNAPARVGHALTALGEKSPRKAGKKKTKKKKRK